MATGSQVSVSETGGFESPFHRPDLVVVHLDSVHENLF